MVRKIDNFTPISDLKRDFEKDNQYMTQKGPPPSMGDGRNKKLAREAETCV